MAAIDFTGVAGCTGASGTFTLQSVANNTGTVIEEWFLQVGGAGHLFDPATDLPLTVPLFNPDPNTLRVRARRFPPGVPFVSYYSNELYIEPYACTVTSTLAAEVSATTAVTAPGKTDGTLTVTATGNNNAILLALNPPGGPTYFLGAPGSYTFPSLAAGVYAVRVSDSIGGLVTILGVVPDAPVNGCTWPGAGNYDPAATVDDGSCVYPLPAADPIFRPAPLNSVRLVVPATPDGCAVFDDVDTQLFCQQARPGQQVRPRYYQLLQYCDAVRVQVLSNYQALSIRVLDYATGAGLTMPAPFTRTLALQGTSDPLAVVLADGGGSTTRVYAEAGGALQASLKSAGVLRLNNVTYAIQYTAWGTLPGAGTPGTAAEYLVISRPWVVPSGAQAITWELDVAAFNVWEATPDLTGLAPGLYQLSVIATDPRFASVAALSEPLLLRTEHAETVVLDYVNADNCYGTVFSTGFAGRLRVRGAFFRSGNGGDVTTSRNSDHSLALLASTATRLRDLETADLPAWLHEKIFLVCRLDGLRVNGIRSTGPANYEYEKQGAYALTTGLATLEIPGFGLGNGHDTGLPADDGGPFLALQQGGRMRIRTQ